MKRKKYVILLCCALCALLIFSIWYTTRGRFKGAYTGMSTAQFEEIIPRDQFFGLGSYIFYDNLFGYAVVAKVSDDYKTIEELRCFDKFTIHPTRAAAESISKGMDVYEVVSKLGTPYGSFTSGMLTMAFLLDDGTFCQVYFNTPREMKVMWTLLPDD